MAKQADSKKNKLTSNDFSCNASDFNVIINRRQFLLGAGAVMTTLSIPNWVQHKALPPRMQAQIAAYPRQLIGRLSQLKVGETVAFNYPWQHPNATNFLIKLGQPAGGGIGPDSDVVAFNRLCTHQGGPMGKLDAEMGVLGPCPIHWTTFDLTRHGMVVSGHATLGLPQIVLETEGDDIYAVGVQGLIFGYYNNLADPSA